ncbi:MAG: LysR family transcriptional regulator [Oscillospiraceae bacterium]|nr:LysR family transcriptional regulator [Oscillospiraceae bacterium]
MNSEYLRTFVTLAQMGSYTKTAQKMIVVPSTISKHIKLLEEETGKVLIVRDKKSIRLTKAGEIFLEYAHRILDAEDACMARLEATEDNRGAVRIGVVSSLFQNRVVPWLKAYLREEPSFRCSVVMDHSQVLLNMLYDGSIDFCITYRGFRENNCECIPFARDEMILVTGGANPVFENGVTVEELRALPLLRETQLSIAAPELFKSIFYRNKNVVLSVTTGNLLVPFLRDGMGYGFAVKCGVEKELASGELKQIRLRDVQPLYLQSYLIYKKTNPWAAPDLMEKFREAAGRE